MTDLTEEDQELIERYEKCKELKISLGHVYQVNEFSLSEIIRLSNLIKRDTKWNKE